MATTAPAPRGTRKPTNGVTEPAPQPVVASIPVVSIDVGDNVRTDVGNLDELVASIGVHGILQPIAVHPVGDARYRLVFGQRRLAAAQLAGLTSIPAMIVAYPGDDAGRRTEEQLVENLQRRDLNPLEEAKALHSLLAADPTLTHDRLAKRIGRSRPWVSATLGILDVDPKVQEHLAAGAISLAHVKAIAALPAKEQRQVIAQAVESGQSSHELERSVAWNAERAKDEAKRRRDTEKHVPAVEVALVEKGATRATSRIANTYYGNDGLRELLKAAGWKLASQNGNTRGKTCDCDAFTVGLTWQGKPEVRRTCISKEHHEAHLQAEREASDRRFETEQANREAAAAEAKRLTAPVSAFLGVASTLQARITLWAIADGSWTARGVLGAATKRDVGYESEKIWAAVASLADNKVLSTLGDVLAAEILEEKPTFPARVALGEVVPELKVEPPAKATRAKKATS